MHSLTRRKFIHDLGLASAGVAGSAALGCGPQNYPSSDFYVMLQGPWLLSAADSRYLLAMTSIQPGYRYDYIDPFPLPRPENKTASPVFEARPGICLNAARSMRLDFCQGDDGGLSEQQRRGLFDGMRDQYQGLFYTAEVKVPDPCEHAENRLAIQLSYPHEIFAMGLEQGVRFHHLTYVHGQRIQQWPTTIVLRYTKWQTAAFVTDGSYEDILVRGQGQIHRKFTISHPLNNPPPEQQVAAGQAAPSVPAGQAARGVPACQSETCVHCCPEKCCPEKCCAESEARDKSWQLQAQNAAAFWSAVMNLAAFPHNEAPVPHLTACTHGKRAEPQTGGDGTIASEELKCLPCVGQGTNLVLSAAGSAGVHGVA